MFRLGLADLCPYSFDLGRAVAGQLGRPGDAMTGSAQGDDLGAALRIGPPAPVLARILCQLDALALPLAAVLVVVAGHL